LTHDTNPNDLIEKVRQLEDEVTELQARNRQLTEDSKDMIWITDGDHKLTYVSPAIESLLGYKPETAIGQHVMANDRSDDREEVMATLRKIDELVAAGDKGSLKNIKLSTRDARLIKSNGDLVPMESRMSMCFAEDDSFLGMMGINRDITERKKIEQRLRSSEKLFRKIFDTSPEANSVMDFETNTYIDVNQGFVSQTGWSPEELIGKTPNQLGLWANPEAEVKLREELTKTNIVRNYEAEFRAKNGSAISALISITFFNLGGQSLILSVTREIESLKQAQAQKAEVERQLYQSQKLDSLGTLAGGIAHDFNNILMGVQGSASLIEQDVQDPVLTIQHVRGIEKLVQHAADLTSQLLGLGQGGKYQVVAVDINELLDEQLRLFSRTHKGISVRVDFGGKLPSIEADSGQIKQVLLNLFLNAWESMTDNKSLIVKTQAVQLTPEEASRKQVKPGQYVKTIVQDHGTGMDEETVKKIFDPFFTTKEVGKNTGMGLASAYGIIKNHKGFISVSSKLSEGTSFEFYLPASISKPKKTSTPSNSAQQGSESVLVVDDEEAVLYVTSKMLERSGYHVFTATGGEEAITMFCENPSIELVVLDMIMPGMDGVETFDKLKEVSPDLKVILSSGFSTSDQAAEMFADRCDGFLQKPYRIADLTSTIREVLDS
jgi:PAS domain S-box-containing protein